MSPRRVVTLPPGETGAGALAFARRARARGAELLEVRTDLHPEAGVPAEALAAVLPLLVAERGRPAPGSWARAADLIDRPLEDAAGPGASAGASLVSLHAARPLQPAEAEARWRAHPPPPGALLKHVEPLGAPAEAARLFETRRRLAALVGGERVTVLPTGPLAVPFRAVLAPGNALDYLALAGDWQAAPGQRLLADALRADRAPDRPRRAILGHGISSSRSPRLHPPPFDRLDLPADAPLAQLLEALLPHYAGLAVTSPFKKEAARLVGGALESVNTLVRRGGRWEGLDTDVDGARAALARLGPDGPLALLGDGGAAVALRTAAREAGVAVTTVRRDAAARAVLPERVVWTWPPGVEPPGGLDLSGRRVGVIAYGAAGRSVAARIRARGGRPVLLGVCWLLAQARRQRRLWESAS